MDDGSMKTFYDSEGYLVVNNRCCGIHLSRSCGMLAGGPGPGCQGDITTPYRNLSGKASQQRRTSEMQLVPPHIDAPIISLNIHRRIQSGFRPGTSILIFACWLTQ